MTREEATIQALQGHIEALNETIENQSKYIKELEQNPILDQIRAEVEQSRQIYEASMDYTDGAREQELSWVLRLIDKYKKESEG